MDPSEDRDVSNLPEVVRLRAQVLEYEHALQHVAERHDGACESCRRIARGALGRVNRQDFEDQAVESA